MNTYHKPALAGNAEGSLKTHSSGHARKSLELANLTHGGALLYCRTLWSPSRCNATAAAWGIGQQREV